MKKYNRRDFIRTSVAVGAGAMIFPSLAFKDDITAGIQLYTLRDLMAKDPRGTLQKLAKIGYKEIELAGYAGGKFYDMPPDRFKRAVEQAGLKIVSGHYQTGQTFPDVKGTMVNEWRKAVDDAASIDQKYMVLAYLHDNERKSISDYYKLTELINRCAEQCKRQGLQFAYHNHDFELQELDGELPFEVLLKETDPELVKIELDIYWTVKAGFDPVELFKENPGRYPLWHVKDMDDSGNFTEVGTGTINYQEIFKNKDSAGLKHFFIEQDHIAGDKWRSVTTSYQNVQKVI